MKRILCVAVAAVFGVALVTQTAEATLQVRVNAGANGSVIDNGAGDLSPLVGVIIANFTTAEFSVLVSIGQGQPVLNNQVTLSTTYTATGVAGNMVIAISDTNHTLVNPLGWTASVGGNLGAGVTQRFDTSLDEANGAYAVGSAGILSLGPVSGLQGLSGARLGVGPTSLWSLSGAVFFTSAGGNAGTGGSSDVSIGLVPEPGTVAIWSVLAGIGFVGASRRRR